MNWHMRSLGILVLSLVLQSVCFAADRIPVILDTDIGDDIDDTWALALLLRSPEVDLKLVVSDNFKAPYRTKLLAKLLERANRTDVAVGMGLGQDDKNGGGQSKWVGNYDLKSYPGKVHQDGIQAMIDLIMSSPKPMTLIAIGPVQNLAEMLRREPEVAKRVRFVGMHGSVRLGYDGNPKPAPEFNVKVDPKACQAAFTADWDMTITPLDTCGLIRLKGDKYQKLRDSKDPLAMTVLENYRVWCGDNPQNANAASSILFDTVAAYLSFSNDLLTMEKLNIRVTDDGMTVIDPKGKSVNVATSWKDLPAFEDLLVKRLTQSN
ncbi:MAG TPA: nucleoside hydrolase [Tepidisphaeraceae bacterium]|nr:nucleoside hydrolase [Tepidisphaeraceae bacterium]